MDPQDWTAPPADVIEDRRLRIETTAEDLVAEAEAEMAGLKQLATDAATKTVQEQVIVSVTTRGRIRKNGPCPCGSGSKFKKCCLAEVQSGEKPLPSAGAMRAYIERKPTK